MKILVIGGSYFLGKTFTQLALNENEVYLLNRGNNKLGYDEIVEYTMDRHDVQSLQNIFEKEFDVVVDFCAYSPGDIKIIFDNLNATFKQYIFVSTCDVYRRQSGLKLDENAPLEERNFGGAAGDYIVGKVALEKELRECAKAKNVVYTSIRPAFIYGPDNYAPREAIYFKWILTAGQIIHPYNATGQFQMVFVLDVAKAILMCCMNEKAYNESFNVCNENSLTYEEFAQVLENAMELEFEKVELSVEEVINKQIPLPFPLTYEESEWYDTSKIKKELGFVYTDIEKGMTITANYYQS